jgi:hypothetical protein
MVFQLRIEVPLAQNDYDHEGGSSRAFKEFQKPTKIRYKVSVKYKIETRTKKTRQITEWSC